jgi:hypothetical protein
VIAFGAAMEDDEAYRRYAMPGIERAKEADSEVYAFAAAGPIPRSYNLVLDMAAGRDDLEALVLVHQDIELADPDLCAKVRAALAEPDVAVVGSAGATGVSGIAWWEGSVSAAPALHRYNEHGSGELPAFSWLQAAPAPAEVETLDGSLLVLSLWAVRNVRFDEALRLGYGFDLDFCRQVRAAGRRVMTADLRTIRHRPLEVVREEEHMVWVEAHISLAEKWDGQLPDAEGTAGSWKERARRAEAEREAARTVAYSSVSDLDAQIGPLERALAEVTGSAAWRLTKPLREFNLWRARRRGELRP